MIDLRGRFIKTENKDEAAALLGMATAQGFKWNYGDQPLSEHTLWDTIRFFCFWDDKKITWCMDPDVEFENFSDLLSIPKESDGTERSITQADFCKAAAEFFKYTETNCAEEIGIALSILERKLFPYTVD